MSNVIARVEDETGLQIETISAEEEARLTVAGCFPLLDPDTERSSGPGRSRDSEAWWKSR